MAIFELSGVDYPRKSLRFIYLSTFAKPYGCVLIFLPKMVLVEFLLLLDYTSIDQTKGGKRYSKVVSTKLYLDFILISRFCTLISSNYPANSAFFAKIDIWAAITSKIGQNWTFSRCTFVHKTSGQLMWVLLDRYLMWSRRSSLFSKSYSSWLGLITWSKILTLIKSSSSRLSSYE